jgi:hypothetical protein
MKRIFPQIASFFTRVEQIEEYCKALSKREPEQIDVNPLFFMQYLFIGNLPLF